MLYKEILKKENIKEKEIAEMLGMKHNSFKCSSARKRYINFIELFYNRINQPLNEVLEKISDLQNEIAKK
jgi:transcriptional regulator with XRE-family HTH domain